LCEALQYISEFGRRSTDDTYFSNELTISHATDIQAIEFKRFNLFSETVFELPLIASTWVAV